jgi:Fe2+ transport system protein B
LNIITNKNHNKIFRANINKKKETIIDVEGLSALLGCPVVETISTSSDGLKNLTKAVLSQVGKTQNAPFVQENIDLSDKKAVEMADRKRFDFVNKLVKNVEKRKVLTKDKNSGDKIQRSGRRRSRGWRGHSLGSLLRVGDLGGVLFFCRLGRVRRARRCA